MDGRTVKRMVGWSKMDGRMVECRSRRWMVGWSSVAVGMDGRMVGWSSVAIRVDGRLTFQADLGLISNPGFI